MNNFYLITKNINVTPLSLELIRQPQLWKEDTYLRDFPQGPFSDIETIFLRFPPGSVTEAERAKRDPHESEWMDGALHLPSARPLIFGLMTQVQGERLGRVLLNKIPPMGRIYPHADLPEHSNYWDRFHYVVTSAPGVVFRCGGEKASMETGDVWWFQNALEHEVVNDSTQDRIHLIVDIRTQHLHFKGLRPTVPDEIV